MKIYLAGPLFASAEQEFNRQLCSRLQQAGHEVWLPQEHEPHEGTAKAIFEEDVGGMDWAEVIVANMDGPDPDSGTAGSAATRMARSPSFYIALIFAGSATRRIPRSI